MASLSTFFTPAVPSITTRRTAYPVRAVAVTTGRVYAATAAKSSSEEKNLLDWIIGGLAKEDQMLETDPILKKVEEKEDGRKNSVVAPPKKKNGVFGGLFAKK